MPTTRFIVYSLALCVFAGFGPVDTHGQESRQLDVQQAESRLRGIYEQREIRAKAFRGEWLPDSSGYTVLETVDGTDEEVLARYDLVTSERTVVETASEEGGDESGRESPDGRYVLHFEHGNLHVRDVQTDQMTPITQNADGVPSLRVGVVDVERRTTRWLSILEPAEGFYLGQVDWAENSHELLVEKLSRFQDEREFLLVDVRTGEIARIFHESDPAWVVASIAKNVGLEWIRDGREFIVISEKDGWRHAYVYTRDGKERTLLTPGPVDIIERVKVDEAEGWFYYNASPENATQKYLYRVRLDGTGTPERVTPMDQPGTHDYEFSPNGKWAFHTFSAFDTPPVIELVQLPEHRVVRVFEDNEKLRKKTKSVIARPTEFFQLDIGDGVVMDAWMIKPTDCDPAKKYPVLVYVYGEPHAQTVLDAWGKVHADYHRVVADLGYLVVSIDNRGTPAPKGAAWRRSIFGKLGVLSTEEQAAGVQELGRTRPFVDLSRVGIWGWSGGGSNTLNAMFRKPDVYDLGIAVAPKPQPHLYNAWFREIYMNTPEVNPDGYRGAAPINFAEGLQGNLLMIHGTGETNTHLEIIEGLVDRLIELGKPFNYMTYPSRDHGIRKGKGTSVHMRMQMIRYLLVHLPPGPR